MILIIKYRYISTLFRLRFILSFTHNNERYTTTEDIDLQLECHRQNLQVMFTALVLVWIPFAILLQRSEYKSVRYLNWKQFLYSQ